MLNCEVKRTRQREFKGPSPGSFAILARSPQKRAVDQIIQDSRAAAEALAFAKSQVEFQKKCDLRADFERRTQHRIERNTVRRRFCESNQQYEMELERRRDRLRCLLAAEDEQCSHDVDNLQETTLERQARMRERARQLKETKELDRLALVAQKRDLQWRNQCEELRTTMSKRTQDEVSAERQDQLRLKEILAEDKRRDEQMYAQLWEEDRLKKVAREERDLESAMRRNKEQVEILQQQAGSQEKRKAEAAALKIEEAELLREMAELLRVEEQRAAEERRCKENATRDLLNMNIRLKLKRRAREVQEELAFDTMILEKLQEETKLEAATELKRKKELRAEDRRYREYLRNMKDEEIARERELDRLVDAEIEKQWQARLDQWRREKEARQTMLHHVIEGRKKQIQERILQNERRQLEAQLEKEAVERDIEINKALQEKELAELQQRGLHYQNDLCHQIEHNMHLAARRHEEERREQEKYAQVEVDYQRKLKAAMDQEWIDPKLHPIRRHLLLQGKSF